MNETKVPGYTSGEIMIPGLLSICQRGVAIFDGKLNVLGKGWENAGINEGWPLIHQQFNLNQLKKTKNTKGKSGLDLVDTKSLENKGNWTKQEMKDPDFRTSGDSGSFAHPALTASPTDMWAFYQGKIRSQSLPLIGRQQTLDETNDGPNTWGPPITMQMSDGTDIKHVGAVSARHFGEDQIIVVAGGYVGMSSDYPSPHKDSIFIGIYDLKNLDDENNCWKAISSKWVKISTLKFYKDKIEWPWPLVGNNFGKNISFDWFQNLASNDQESPEYGLAINFSPEGHVSTDSPTLFISLITKKDTGMIIGWESDSVKGYLRSTAPGLGESGLMRDPAGRLRSYNFNSDPGVQRIQSRYYNTAVFPSPANNFESSGLQETPWYKITPHKLPGGVDISSIIAGFGNIHPRGVFHAFNHGRTSPDKGKEDLPILEFTFYGLNMFQLNYYGTIRTISATKKPNKNQTPKGPTIILGGIIDGPIPFPIENYFNFELSGGSDEVGSINYKRGKEIEEEKSVESSWTAGFESEGKTTKGIGPAWKISVEGGMGSVMTKSKGSETDHKLTVPATVVSHKPFKDPEVDGIGAAKVLAAEFNITGCQFIDESNRIINDSLSKSPSVGPKAVGILTTMLGTDESYSFETYSAIPGNLESYTPEQLNIRMKKLGYDGKDYFNEVIQANAFPFTDEEPYLLFKWNEGTVEGSGFRAFNSSFQEQKWTFDGSVYGGVSGGEGINIFGLGEEFETEFLVGASYSRENSEATTNEISWGIEVEGKENWGGPPVRNLKDAPDSVKSYTFRLYFLPVPSKDSGLHPNYWTKELIDNVHDGERIDHNSGSWRIMYVVTKIEYNDPNKEGYPKNGSIISS